MQTSEKSNKPVRSGNRRSRNPNGNPRPYFSENRWKAPGYIVDRQGNRFAVMGTGSSQAAALRQLERNRAKKLQQLSLIETPTHLVRVEDYLREWLAAKVSVSNLSYKTATGYRVALDKWVIPRIGNMRLLDVTRLHVDQIFKDVAAMGKSRSTQVQIRAVLQPAFQEAVDNGFISQSPYLNIRLKPIKQSTPQYHDSSAVKAILRAANSSIHPLRWTLALIYGMRQGEVLGLQWSDVDLQSENPRIVVSKQLQRQTQKGLVLVPVKTFKSNRSIPLLPGTAESLKALKEQFQTERGLNPQWNPDGFLFPTILGTPMDHANDRKEWQRLIKNAGVQDLPLKSARATSATNLGDVSAAHSLLGHADIAVTSRYYEAVPTQRILRGLKELGIEELQNSFGD